MHTRTARTQPIYNPLLLTAAAGKPDHKKVKKTKTFVPFWAEASSAGRRTSSAGVTLSRVFANTAGGGSSGLAGAAKVESTGGEATLGAMSSSRPSRFSLV